MAGHARPKNLESIMPDFSALPEGAKILDDSDGLILYSQSEDTYILTGATFMSVGDHYGNPTCGVIDRKERWCVTGGEGLIVADFPSGGSFFDQQPNGRLRQKLRFPDGATIHPVLIVQIAEDTVRFVHDLTDEKSVGIYDLNVVDLTIRKVRHRD